MQKKVNGITDIEPAVEHGAAVEDEQRFSKAQISEALKYRDRKDLVCALLDDDKTYTMEQVDEMIYKFMRGKVK